MGNLTSGLGVSGCYRVYPGLVSGPDRSDGLEPARDRVDQPGPRTISQGKATCQPVEVVLQAPAPDGQSRKPLPAWGGASHPAGLRRKGLELVGLGAGVVVAVVVVVVLVVVVGRRKSIFSGSSAWARTPRAT